MIDLESDLQGEGHKSLEGKPDCNNIIVMFPEDYQWKNQAKKSSMKDSHSLEQALCHPALEDLICNTQINKYKIQLVISAFP